MSRLNRLIPVLVFALVCLFTLSGCITEKLGFQSSVKDNAKILSEEEVYNFSPLSSRYNLDPPLAGDSSLDADWGDGSDYDPLAKYAQQTYYGADGVITRHFYFPANRGKNIAQLLTGQIPSLSFTETNGKDIKNRYDGEKARLAVNQILVITGATNDKRDSAVKLPGFSAYQHSTGPVSDLMIVRVNDPKMLMDIDSYLTNLLHEIPQIEIKVRVVEIAVSDDFQWGGENVISRLTSSGKYFLKDWFNFYNTETFTSAGGANDFQGALFDALGSHDKLNLDATFEMLQRTGDADILVAPTLTVLNGHRAIIQTGDEVPSQKITFNATQAFYSYSYLQTGVTLAIVPYLLPNDIIEVDMNAEVISVTGRENFDVPGGTLSQPILAKRNANTRIQVKDGEAFAIGGLMSTVEYEIISKLPLLGDIPILGYLFKNKHIQKSKSQIIFYVEPRVVKREDGWKERKED